MPALALEWQLGVEVDRFTGSEQDAWTSGGTSKFANNNDSTSLQGYFDVSYALTDTLKWEVVGEATSVGEQDLLGLTEAYLHWRPVPRSRIRLTSKVGAFYPPISLENTQPGWRSPFTRNFSAINSWVAEELRTFGAQVAVELRPWADRIDRLELGGAVFKGNDPTGAILAWRGWSMHAQQSRFQDGLPLQTLPQFAEGRFFAAQASESKPFNEVDGRWGGYGFVQWRSPGRLSLQGLFYDNRADPAALQDGQYAWATQFIAVGMKTQAGPFDLIAQWMDGETVMGSRWRSAATFMSYFFLLSKDIERHRFALRYDWFDVKDFDDTPQDNNDESGRGVTLSYRWQFSDQWQLLAEWMQNKTRRPGWMYAGLATSRSEHTWSIGLSWQL